MRGYQYKKHDRLVYEANVKRIRCEGRIILDALLNEALHEHDEEFHAAQQEGRLVELGDNQQLIRLLRTAAQRHLGLSTPSGRGPRALPSRS